MKRIGGFILSTSLLLLCTSMWPLPKAAALNCTEVENYGAIKLFLPEVSTKQEYVLWLRLQTSQSQAHVLVDINGTQCLEVIEESNQAFQWYWQAYEQSNAVKTLRFDQSQGNSVRIIGVQAGLKIDKVLLTEPDCMPQEFGENCKNIEAVGLSSEAVTTLPPPSTEAVSGKVMLSLTPQIVGIDFKTVRYVAEGRTLQTNTLPEPFDTTLVTNGKHTIHIETELADGRIIREMTVVEVDNIENVFSPIIRWVRLNMGTLALTGLALAGIIMLLLLISLVRNWFLRRRKLHFHGF